MDTHKHYLYRLLTTALLVFAVGGIAGAVPPGQPFQQRSLAIGSEFDTVRVRCGTRLDDGCPNYNDPVGRPYLLHYVTMGGSANVRCTFGPAILRQTSDGTDDLTLQRLYLGTDAFQPWSTFGISDNTVLTFPVPLRGQASDRLGVFRFTFPGTETDPGTPGAPNCLVFAVFGIEYLE